MQMRAQDDDLITLANQMDMDDCFQIHLEKAFSESFQMHSSFNVLRQSSCSTSTEVCTPSPLPQ